MALALIVHGRAAAQDFVSIVAQATDAAAATPFTVSPSIPAGVKGGFWVGAALRPGEAWETTDELNGTVEGSTARAEALGVAWVPRAAGGGAGLRWSVLAEMLRAEGGDSDFASRGLRGRVDTGLLGSVRLALGVRLQSVEAADVRYTDDKVSDSKALLIGGESGIFVGDGSGGFGVSYAPPLRGKAEAEGESKLVAQDGGVGIEGVGAWSPKLTLAGVVRVALRDEDAEGRPADGGAMFGMGPAASLELGVQRKGGGGGWFQRAGLAREFFGGGGSGAGARVGGLGLTRLKVAVGKGSAGVESRLAASAYARVPGGDEGPVDVPNRAVFGWEFSGVLGLEM